MAEAIVNDLQLSHANHQTKTDGPSFLATLQVISSVFWKIALAIGGRKCQEDM